MVQKMTLTAYLAQRGVKAKALTKGEADLLGIPYPLQSGWPRKYGEMEIGERLFEQLMAHAEIARQAVKMRAAQAKGMASKRASATQASSSQHARVSSVPGFVLRKPRRLRLRKPAPWV